MYFKNDLTILQKGGFMFSAWRQKYLVNFWSPIPAVVALGILATYYFGITGTYWAVTGEFTRWGGQILSLLGVDVSNWGYFKIIGLQGTPLDRVDGVMIIGMFAGCLASAALANNIKFRLPQNGIRVAQALIGGIIAGFGARIGMGCNLASFFTGIPQFSLHAWFFTLATLVGVYLGSKVILLPIFRSHIKLQKVEELKKLPDEKERAKFLTLIGVLVLVGIAIWICYYLLFSQTLNAKGISILGLAMLFGVGFGFIISRAQVCFTSAFRDLFITGRGYMARAVVFGMIVSTIGIFTYILLGLPPKIMWAGPNAIIGGFLFGFGIVIAGGCECGWMYRAVEGQVHYWIVGIGNVIGATILAATWDLYSAQLATSFPRINLLGEFGNYGGLLVNYLLLFGFLAFILVVERRYFKNTRFSSNA